MIDDTYFEIKKSDTEEIKRVISTLSRKACEDILERIYIQVYDSEGLEDLRDAVEANYMDGCLEDDDILGWEGY